MIENVNFQSWKEFAEFLPTIAPEYNNGMQPTNLLFRGQSNQSWRLSTTLERAVPLTSSVAEYYHVTDIVRPAIESFTENKWDVKSREDIFANIQEYDRFSVELSMHGIPNYSYLAYLRHHGFPSPFLDWTRSPYIAAFFAFQDAGWDPVSIYILHDAPHGVKIRSPKPCIFRLGQFVRTHRRHFLQQSDYTVCVSFNQHWQFSSHEEAFVRGEDYQEKVWKITFPGDIACGVLQMLDQSNINSYSLFGSEDGLLRTLSERAFRLNSLPYVDRSESIEDNRTGG